MLEKKTKSTGTGEEETNEGMYPKNTKKRIVNQ
jgi:hypothetical protein